MARSFNQVVLMGNLTRDPDLRTTPSGQSVCNFSLALNRSYKGQDGEWKEMTDFIDIVAWGPLGERVAQYLTKGRPALVSGRLQSRSWEQDGQKRNKVEVVAQDVTFLGSPSGSAASSLATDEPTAAASDDKKAVPKKKKDDKNPPAVGTKDEEDVVIEDIGDEPINLDDIPF
ncbi:single-stranded DNA-binding protein [Candidatus Saccharibacteria bacterium]|nr:single-stranded DNA-binding protein [Candidatus Saccharibacteria bacterium]